MGRPGQIAGLDQIGPKPGLAWQFWQSAQVPIFRLFAAWHHI